MKARAFQRGFVPDYRCAGVVYDERGRTATMFAAARQAFETATLKAAQHASTEKDARAALSHMGIFGLSVETVAFGRKTRKYVLLHGDEYGHRASWVAAARLAARLVMASADERVTIRNRHVFGPP